MTQDLSSLREILGDRVGEMDDLKRYFESVASGEFSGRSRSVGLDLLDPARVATQTLEFREFHPLVRTLDLLLIDDSNTSNYHCYVPGIPFPGTVLYLSHDGRPPCLVFPSLDRLLEIAREAISSGVWLDELHQNVDGSCPDQEGIDRMIQHLIDDYDEETDGVLHLLIAYSNLSTTDTFIELASDPDFEFGVTIAQRILDIPSESLLSIAEACSNNPSEEISDAGKLAVAAIKGSVG